MAVFRRSMPPPLPHWKVRLDAVRGQVRAARMSEAGLLDEVDNVEREVALAAIAAEKVNSSLEAMEPDRIEGELKDALRTRSQLAETSAAYAAHDRLVLSLQRRRQIMHQLRDRSELLELTINTAVADVESLVAQHIELSSLAPTMRAEVLAEVADQLRVDLESLRAAHAELNDL